MDAEPRLRHGNKKGRRAELPEVAAAFFFQAEDGIRDHCVTGVQTCALPISMIVLGISCFYHDASACLVRDGQIIAAAAEERFTRKKHDNDFPIHAINFCLSWIGIPIEKVDRSEERRVGKECRSRWSPYH